MTKATALKRYEGDHLNKFNIGDLVRVYGYDRELWRVDGYVYSHHVYYDEEWTELCYELTNVENNEWIDAFEEDMQLVAQASEADEYLKRYRAVMGRRRERERRRMTVQERIDSWLDRYNVYKTLYKKTRNESFKTWMEEAKEKIRGLIDKTEAE